MVAGRVYRGYDPSVMSGSTTVIASLILLIVAGCGGDSPAPMRDRQPSARERDEQMRREQAHAAAFSVGDPVRVRDSEERLWLRGQTGRILSIERMATLQHAITEQETGREIPPPVSRFRIVLDDLGAECWVAPADVERTGGAPGDRR